jgi:hypothetical protein
MMQSEDLLQEMQLLDRPPDVDIMSITARYWALVNGPIADVFRQADLGLLFDVSESATVKLATLQAAIRATLIAHSVAPRVAERWELYNANLFSSEAIGNVEESPVSVTLNCAPPPHDACLCISPRAAEDLTVPSRWTPDYLSAIVDALIGLSFMPEVIMASPRLALVDQLLWFWGFLLCVQCVHVAQDPFPFNAW